MASRKLSPEQKQLTKFYSPYLSDEEDDNSDSELSSSESDTSSNSSGTSGEPTASESRQNIFASNGFPVSQMSGDKVPGEPIGAPIAFKQTTTKFSNSKNATTVMINSTDRDTNIYPQPTVFSIRLPRIYRNVVGISVTQIKLLSSFYYFSASKNNTSMTINEYGRQIDICGQMINNNITKYLTDGTYDTNSLVTELQNQLNMTPLYNNISLTTFIGQFISTGNYSLLFNDPGDTTYNPLTGVFETLQFKSNIISRYFNIGISSGVTYYTTAQCLVAYYYPMLRDMTIGNVPFVTPVTPSPFAKTNCTTYVISGSKTYPGLNYYETDSQAITYLSGASSYDRIVYGFQGLNDPYISLLVNDKSNQAILQQYKNDNTWNGYLVNNYTCVYNSHSGRLTIYSNSLNTSLVTTFNNQYQTFILQEYANAGINPNEVPAIQTNSENLNGVVIDMYNFIQTGFTNFFAVNFGQYTPTFFTDISNSLFIREANGRYGWDITYTGAPQLSNSNVTYPDASGSWPSLVFDPALMSLSNGDLFYQSSHGEVQYTYTQHNLLTDSSGNIILNESNEESIGYQDISFNIVPTTYVSVPFQSRCRQTLYFETIPPFVNEINPSSEQYYLDPVHTPLLYQTDASDSIILLDPVASDFFMFDISQNMLDGPDFMRQNSTAGQVYLNYMREQKPINNPTTVPPLGSLSMFTFRPHVFIELHHCNYPVEGKDTLISSDIYIEREDGLPMGVDITAFWYRDRAAFMADVSNALVNVYWNNPKNYFIQTAILANSTGAIINTNFISNQHSYLMITTSTINFAKIPLRVFAILHNSYGVYTYPSILDYRRLPIQTTYLATKETPATNFVYPLPTLFNSSGFRNCYDLNGVSNNLLDYFILTTDFSHYDPYNIVNNTTLTQNALQYIFQFKTLAITPPIATSTYSQFFASGSSNIIFDAINNTNYYTPIQASNEITNKTLPFTGINNEFVFINWFRAGATKNLYNSGITTPSQIPEQTVAGYPLSDTNGVDNPFSVIDSISYARLQSNSNYHLYKFSPFALCKNKLFNTTDISFNNISSLLPPSAGEIYLGPDINTGTNNILGIIGIPFTPPLGRYAVPKQVVIKFAYTQPVFSVSTDKIGRNTNLTTTTVQPYQYSSEANLSLYTGNVAADLANWDDHFYQNRQNVILGVFKSKDINGANINSLSPSNALCTLTLKKITQINEFSSPNDPTAAFSRTRTPDWGTYYVYEASTTATNNWVSCSQTFIPASSSVSTKWAAVTSPIDISSNIFTTINSPTGSDTKAYYSDVSNNSLCFIPFYPNLTSEQLELSQDTNPTVMPFNIPFSDGNWSVGTFTGLTYTTRPYIPILTASSLAANPYIFYNSLSDLNSVCVENIATGGISLGDTSTYLGTCGPLCWGVDDTGTIVSPNYRSGVPFTPTFFNIRVNLTISDTIYNSVQDLTAFGGSAEVNLCYADTQMFIYNTTENPNSDYNDISGGWGDEKNSNFIKFDDDSGYNYLSYIPSVKIDKGSRYTIHIRGYVPTVSFLSGLRLVGKNYTDFGEVTLKNICDEIAELTANGVSINPDGTLNNDAYRIANFFSADYVRTLLLFNNSFIFTNKVFGQGFTNASYIGESITSTGFADFLSQYNGVVTSVADLTTNISNATKAANNDMVAWISTNYSGILPDIVLTRNNFTDPLTFSILFQSKLMPPYSTAYDQWGLGWNLGFAKADTPYTTRHVANSFIKIVDDFIYLMLDDALNLNGLDISSKENLSLSRDTFGQKQQYYAKLLLNTFGSFSQTLIQSAKTFSIPLGRLDKLTFSLYDANNKPINNNDCEYNIVLEISEMVDTIDPASILVKGS